MRKREFNSRFVAGGPWRADDPIAVLSQQRSVPREQLRCCCPHQPPRAGVEWRRESYRRLQKYLHIAYTDGDDDVDLWRPIIKATVHRRGRLRMLPRPLRKGTPWVGNLLADDTQLGLGRTQLRRLRKNQARDLLSVRFWCNVYVYLYVYIVRIGFRGSLYEKY